MGPVVGCLCSATRRRRRTSSHHFTYNEQTSYPAIQHVERSSKWNCLVRKLPQRWLKALTKQEMNESPRIEKLFWTHAQRNMTDRMICPTILSAQFVHDHIAKMPTRVRCRMLPRQTSLKFASPGCNDCVDIAHRVKHAVYTDYTMLRAPHVQRYYSGSLWPVQDDSRSDIAEE